MKAHKGLEPLCRCLKTNPRKYDKNLLVSSRKQRHRIAIFATIITEENFSLPGQAGNILQKFPQKNKKNLLGLFTSCTTLWIIEHCVLIVQLRDVTALCVKIKHNEKPYIEQRWARRKTMMSKITKLFIAYQFEKPKRLIFVPFFFI